MVWASLIIAVVALVLAAAALAVALLGGPGSRPAGSVDRPQRPSRPSTALAASGVDAQAVRHVAVVRYDAFPDLGGQLSYSVALLDATGDGVVLSAVNGRRDGRSYAKGILDGQGEQPLTPEERHAVDAALGQRG